MVDRNQIEQAVMELIVDTLETTTALFHALAGMNAVREGYSTFPVNPGASLCTNVPYIDVDLCASITGPRFLEREGRAEQLLFVGWIDQIYQAWEHFHRKEIFAATGPNSIPAEVDPVGDLRRIRNDLIHNGEATEGQCGKCLILKWFDLGEVPILRLRHVFDFLNQMGLMGKAMFIAQSAGRLASASWTISGSEQTLRSRPTPDVISIRPIGCESNDPDDLWPGLSLVFENGIHSVVRPQREGALPLEETKDIIRRSEIDEQGGLRLGNGSVLSSAYLYRASLDVEFQDQKKGSAGRYVPGVSFTIGRRRPN